MAMKEIIPPLPPSTCCCGDSSSASASESVNCFAADTCYSTYCPDAEFESQPNAIILIADHLNVTLFYDALTYYPALNRCAYYWESGEFADAITYDGIDYESMTLRLSVGGDPGDGRPAGWWLEWERGNTVGDLLTGRMDSGEISVTSCFPFSATLADGGTNGGLTGNDLFTGSLNADSDPATCISSPPGPTCDLCNAIYGIGEDSNPRTLYFEITRIDGSPSYVSSCVAAVLGRSIELAWTVNAPTIFGAGWYGRVDGICTPDNPFPIFPNTEVLADFNVMIRCKGLAGNGLEIDAWFSRNDDTDDFRQIYQNGRNEPTLGGSWYGNAESSETSSCSPMLATDSTYTFLGGAMTVPSNFHNASWQITE